MLAQCGKLEESKLYTKEAAEASAIHLNPMECVEVDLSQGTCFVCVGREVGGRGRDYSLFFKKRIKSISHL